MGLERCLLSYQASPFGAIMLISMVASFQLGEAEVGVMRTIGARKFDIALLLSMSNNYRND